MKNERISSSDCSAGLAWKPSLPNKLAGYLFSFFVLIYKYGFSAFFPPSCRFTPSCSTYSLEAFKKYGAIKGLRLTVKRLLRCHPRHPGGYDPVP